MQITIISFGQIAEVTGPHPSISGLPADTDKLLQALHEKYPTLQKLPFRMAVDKNIIQQNTPLGDGSVVALLPPYSGG